MPAIDVLDSTWICARSAVVAAAVAEPASWPRWWPELQLVLDELRDAQGLRWTVRSAPARMAGSMEIWLEPALDGVVLHYFLRLDPTDGAAVRRRRRARLAEGYRRRAKQVFWALGDRLDPARTARIAAPR